MSSPAHNYLKVEGHDGLYRDPTSGAIVNRNKSGYEAYMDSVRLARAKDEAAALQADKINRLENELADIKALLTQLLNKDN